ncbi:MAG: galactose mutarotase [Lachnospiraceae bacterium]|nr:galactose mutarotase [Lachnospiraceae bacterium]
MSVKTTSFGTTREGTEVTMYTIENKNGMRADVIDYGANLVNLFVKGADGKERDVVLGFDTVAGYEKNVSFFGATIGPIANRTKDASFEIDGVKYQMDVNDNENNLHSHFYKGFHKLMWKASFYENSVTFKLEKKDMEIGHPGNMKVKVTYTLTDENELKIHYEATSDKDTIINMTNHTYFNLNGHDSGKIYDEKLCLKAAKYTPVLPGAIPIGEIAAVRATPMDFTEPKKIGEEINADFEQMLMVKGYDHNWVVDHWDGELRLIATLEDENSGIVMETYSDLPGVQFYAGNCITPETGKQGAAYEPRCGLCLETQYFPNSANQDGFERPLFGPEKPYDTTTVYKFVVK